MCSARKFALDLSFKGERDYLHGTDIIQGINDSIRSSGGVIQKISFRKKARRQVVLTIHSDNMPDEEHVAEGLISFGESVRQFFVQETDILVTKNYPYDEERLADSSVLLEGEITISSIPGYSVIEMIVAATKCLAQGLSEPNGKRWMFARLDFFQEMPKTCSNVRVLKCAFARERFLRGKVEIDSIYHGDILFIADAS